MSGEIVDQQFGQWEGFSLNDVTPENREVTAETELATPRHQHGLLLNGLKKRGVTRVIAGGMGARALSHIHGASNRSRRWGAIQRAPIVASPAAETKGTIPQIP
jgi:hypothetical protein